MIRLPLYPHPGSWRPRPDPHGLGLVVASEGDLRTLGRILIPGHTADDHARVAALWCTSPLLASALDDCAALLAAAGGERMQGGPRALADARAALALARWNV